MKWFNATVLILILSSFSLSKPKKTITYIDGNNNQFKLIKKKLIYTPVKKQNSSSGIYEGKEVNQNVVKLSTQQKSYIESITQLLIEDSTNLIDRREMGCGTLVILSKEDTSTYYISRKSVFKSEFETYLYGLF